MAQRRGQATRADIINVARRLFSEHGYHQTGISDIQTATGLTKGAFYHHFRSKEEVALAVLEVARADYEREWLQPAANEPTPGRRLAAMLDGLVALNNRPEWCNCEMLVSLCASLTASHERLREAVQNFVAGMLDIWQNAVAEAQQVGEADSTIDATMWAQRIMDMVSGAILLEKVGGSRVELTHLCSVVKGELLRPGAVEPEPQPEVASIQ